LAHLQIGTHPSTGNYPSLEASEKLARELGVSLNVHLHESKADPATGQKDALRRAGALRPGLITNHTIQMTDAELDELAAHDVRVAHNPLSNMRLASGVIRLPEMHKRGMKVDLGLDGEIGSLTPGKKADVQVINAQALNFAPRVDWVNQLVFSTQPSNT
jgi:5-methylthioadenosine/S-adenosylhomocysteine deaminase